jgi:protein-tyrosine phosphatase
MEARGTELHFHALHGLDDGPTSLAESVELLRLAEEDGTASVVATPHVRTDFVTDVSDLPDRVRELADAAAAEGIHVELRTGGELGHDMVGRLTQLELNVIANGPSTGRWLLVEAPFHSIGEDFHAATDELRDRGFGVMIAHPERSADATLDGGAGLRRELAAGSLAQVNAQSITGGHGPDPRAAALGLIAEGLVSVVASDAHGPTRPPLLGEVRRLLADDGFDVGLCRGLTVGGPRGLLARGIRRRAALVA